ncbi:MAG: 50S ribosomal protein L7/L12 [Gemmatimonadota bacterium]|nr:50S ribosomal protein L7/L12 [Gemmatimonadota bacterium]
MATATLKKEDIITAIEKMTVLELNELVKELEDRFGVSAAAPMMAAAPVAGAAGADAGAAEEEQTEFDVVLTTIGDKKIQVIKAVREVTSLGLKEAKAVVDNPGKPFKEGITKEEAEQIKTKLEEVGAVVEIK